MANKLADKVAPKASKTKPVAVKIVSDTRDYPAADNKWRAESDLRTVTEARQIMADRSRMKEVKRIAKEQMKNLSSVCSPSKR